MVKPEPVHADIVIAGGTFGSLTTVQITKKHGLTQSIRWYCSVCDCGTFD